MITLGTTDAGNRRSEHDGQDRIARTRKRHVYKMVESPVGRLTLVATDEGLAAILWENDRPRRVRLNIEAEDSRPSCARRDRAPARGVFCGAQAAVRVEAGPVRDGLSAPGLERAADDPVRRNAILRADREADREPWRRSRGRRGERQESRVDRRALPSRRRIERRADGIRRRPRRQGASAGARRRGANEKASDLRRRARERRHRPRHEQPAAGSRDQAGPSVRTIHARAVRRDARIGVHLPIEFRNQHERHARPERPACSANVPRSGAGCRSDPTRPGFARGFRRAPSPGAVHRPSAVAPAGSASAA